MTFKIIENTNLYQMADGRKNNGGARPGAGRPPKADEQKLIEQLTPHDDLFIEGITKAMRTGESWAFKLFADYRYGKPTQRIEQSGPDGGPQQHEVKHLADYTDEEVMDLAEQVAAYKKAQNV